MKRLIASPFLRCVQTLEPLGLALGLPVEPDRRLAEGRGRPARLAIAEEVRRQHAPSSAATGM